MPLYTYKCNGCDAEAREMLLPGPVKGMKCPYCATGVLIQKIQPCNIRYGKSMVGAIPSKGTIVPATGKLVKDTFEYEKEVRRAGCEAISHREYEKHNENRKRDMEKEVKVAKAVAKEEVAIELAKGERGESPIFCDSNLKRMKKQIEDGSKNAV